MGRSGNVDGIGAVRMFPYKNRNWKSECHSAAPRSKSRHSSPPEGMYLDILGSRKPVLFIRKAMKSCNGRQNF